MTILEQCARVIDPEAWKEYKYHELAHLILANQSAARELARTKAKAIIETVREEQREALASAWIHGHCRARGFTFAETDIPGCKGSFLWGQAMMEAVALQPSEPAGQSADEIDES